MTDRPKAVLIGDVEHAKYHPLTGFDRELVAILSDFDLSVATDEDAFLEERLAGMSLAVVMTDRWTPLSDDRAAGLLSFVARGGGLLLIHSGISIQARPDLAELAGGRFTGHPEQAVLNYRPTAAAHPVLEGVEPFSAKEEPYRLVLDGSAAATVLLEYAHEDAVWAAGWARSFGRGRVVLLSPGHNLATLSVPAYRRLIANSARWLAGSVRTDRGKD